MASLKDENYFSLGCQRVIDARDSLASDLATLGFQVLPSRANFVFVSHAQVPARELFDRLRERGIVVRYFDKPRIDNYLRISIGADDDNKALLVALKELLEKG